MKYVINIDLSNPIREGVYADLNTGATWILSERMMQKLTPLEDTFIRCKECKYFTKKPDSQMPEFHYCDFINMYTLPTDYCSYAEREEQDDG